MNQLEFIHKTFTKVLCKKLWVIDSEHKLQEQWIYSVLKVVVEFMFSKMTET